MIKSDIKHFYISENFYFKYFFDISIHQIMLKKMYHDFQWNIKQHIIINNNNNDKKCFLSTKSYYNILLYAGSFTITGINYILKCI